MKDVIHPVHRVADRLDVANVADVELHFGDVVRVASLELVPHVVLLLLITGKDANLPHVGSQEMLKDGVSKGTSPSRDH